MSNRDSDGIEKYSDVSIVDNYGYRASYHPDFFKHLASRLAVDNSSACVDLLCGRGEIASLAKDHFGTVIAVDGSSEMLRRASEHPNVSYHNWGDVNSAAFTDHFAGVRYKYWFIGRAAHWITLEGLNKLRANAMTNDVVVTTMSAGFSMNNPWWNVYKSLMITPFRDDPSPNRNWKSGKLLEAGFRAIDSVTSTYNVTIDTSHLIGNAMSYTPNRNARIASNMNELRNSLLGALKPWLLDDGRLQAVISNEAFLFKIKN